MRRVLRTDLAEQDLAEILAYLDERSPPAADQFAAELDARCRLIAGQPGMGRARDDLGPGLRSVVVRKYVVIFRTTDDVLLVIRILHGSRDIDTIMRGEA